MAFAPTEACPLAVRLPVASNRRDDAHDRDRSGPTQVQHTLVAVDAATGQLLHRAPLDLAQSLSCSRSHASPVDGEQSGKPAFCDGIAPMALARLHDARFTLR